MRPEFFKIGAEFREWLSKNHLSEKELYVGYYKFATGKPSLSWSESVDQAICYGWIDGIRKSIDEESYCIRFTPRNPKSNWSEVNIKKAEELISKGLMQPKGLELFNNRKTNTKNEYSYESKPKNLPNHLENRIKTNKLAWQFFNAQSDSYKRTIYYWILSARQGKTKEARTEKLIKLSELGQKLF